MALNPVSSAPTQVAYEDAAELPLPLKLCLRKGDVTFAQCLKSCIENREFVEQYDRLSNTNLSMKGTALDLMIDEATERGTEEIKGFVDFVFDVVFLRL